MNGPAFKRGGFARALETQAKRPPRVVDLAPDAWADTCPTKPSAPVKVGLRLLPEQELNHRRAAAVKEAWRLHPREDDEANRIDCFNQQLIGMLVSEAATEPDDIGKPFFGEAADTKIFRDLTTDGIRRLWDEYEILVLLTSPTAPEASDEDLADLGDGLLSGELIASLDIERARRVRRLLRAALDAVDVSR